MAQSTSTGAEAPKPSRRDSLRLIAAALVAPALLPAGAPAQDAGPSTAAPASPPPEPPPAAEAASPWPTTAKLQKTNDENVAALRKVPLGNGDAPDLLPHPPTRGRAGGGR